MHTLRRISHYIEDIFFGQKLASEPGEHNVLTFLGNSQINDQYCEIIVLGGHGNRVSLGEFWI
jgi:hypothetical protein